jgi:transglutaminase-like putative cysteine protease
VRKIATLFLSGLFMVVVLTACNQAPSSPTPRETSPPAPSPDSTRTYTVGQRLILSNLGPGYPDKQNLWVALIRDVSPYQSAHLRRIYPEKYQPVTDEYGNQYAEFDLTDHPPGKVITVALEYEVIVYGQRFDLGNCQGEMPGEYTQPELHIESANPQIVGLAEELSRGTHNVCEQARAFYDHIGDELVYSHNRKDWGAQATFGEMGADCTEFTSLMIALSRAAGIPARYYEGLLYLNNKGEGLAQTEHAWLDIYLPGAGWVTVDPTLGRSRLHRETHYAQYTPDHIIITTGRNPSTLRGSSYWSHLYWPGDSARITIEDATWSIERIK